ncbi:hypothetical protein E2I00_005899, partial [Balaenoptera physalus]
RQNLFDKSSIDRCFGAEVLKCDKGHCAFQIWKPLGQVITETAKKISTPSFSSYYKGGFEQKMNRESHLQNPLSAPMRGGDFFADPPLAAAAIIHFNTKAFELMTSFTTEDFSAYVLIVHPLKIKEKTNPNLSGSGGQVDKKDCKTNPFLPADPPSIHLVISVATTDLGKTVPEN